MCKLKLSVERLLEFYLPGGCCERRTEKAAASLRGAYYDAAGREFTSRFWSEGDTMTFFEYLLRFRGNDWRETRQVVVR